jgi:hypothetical protein
MGRSPARPKSQQLRAIRELIGNFHVAMHAEMAPSFVQLKVERRNLELIRTVETDLDCFEIEIIRFGRD